MNKLNVFCFGFGQTAKSFVKKLKIEKIPFKLTATSRQETQNKNFEDINIDVKDLHRLKVLQMKQNLYNIEKNSS